MPAITHAVWRAVAESRQRPAREAPLAEAAHLVVVNAELEAVAAREVAGAVWAMVATLPLRKRG